MSATLSGTLSATSSATRRLGETTRTGRGQRGSSLLVAVLILLLAFLVLLAVTTRAASSSRAVREAQQDAHAFNAAEAGLAGAVQALLDHDDGDTGGPVGLGLARYEVESRTLGWRGPWRRMELLSIGRSGERSVGLRAVVDIRLPAPGEVFPPPKAQLRSWERLARNAID